MNAAVRAIVRSAPTNGLEVVGVRNGYAGLLRGEFLRLGCRDVGGIVERGGTFLGSSRCDEMRDEHGQRTAIDRLRAASVDGLVVIGGNGSQAGAFALASHGYPVIGIASTIDNDLAGTDISIGATTAVQTAIDAIDKLRVTASSHRRAFLVEVMGRKSGYLALMAGIGSGAEAIVIPEADIGPDGVVQELLAAEERGKKHAIVVVAEGATHDADAIAAHFAEHRQRLGFELRVTRLGHVQRGGAPCAFDRLIATQLGAAATDRFAAGEQGLLLGMKCGSVGASALSTALQEKALDLSWLSMARTLAQ